MKKEINAYKWSPWIGCHAKSEGCKFCTGKQTKQDFDTTIQLDLGNFDLPLQRNKKGQYYIKKGAYIALEYNSDFFIQDMDFFRPYIWNIIKARSDCYFYTTTKRPERIKQCLPKNWGKGWDNVDISCTVENQQRLEERLPIYLNLPLKHYKIMACPLLEELDFSNFLKQQKIQNITVGGEYAVIDHPLVCSLRECKYTWIRKIADQCKQYNIDFYFSRTGSYWINENNKEEFFGIYDIEQQIQRTKSYNLSTTNNLLSLPVDYFQDFRYINKEE